MLYVCYEPTMLYFFRGVDWHSVYCYESCVSSYISFSLELHKDNQSSHSPPTWHYRKSQLTTQEQLNINSSIYNNSVTSPQNKHKKIPKVDNKLVPCWISHANLNLRRWKNSLKKKTQMHRHAVPAGTLQRAPREGAWQPSSVARGPGSQVQYALGTHSPHEMMYHPEPL